MAWRTTMPLRFACPSCKTHYAVRTRDAGRKAECRVCGQRVEVPSAPRKRTVLGVVGPVTPPPASPTPVHRSLPGEPGCEATTEPVPLPDLPPSGRGRLAVVLVIIFASVGLAGGVGVVLALNRNQDPDRDKSMAATK